MRRLICSIVFLLFYASVSSNESTLQEEIEAMLFDAAADVLAQNADFAAKPGTPPLFDMPADFMRSFQPGTGVGNRDELVVEGILPLPVYDDVNFSRFLFKHFNHTDYIAGISDYKMILYKFSASDKQLVLSWEEVVFTYDSEWAIMDVVLYIRSVKYTESLYVAIATGNEKNSVVHVYEIAGDSGELAAVISRSSSSVGKLSYVKSSYGGYLAFLIPTERQAGLVYQQKGLSETNRYIEVDYPSAIDLVTFTVHGHGYIAVANPGFCDVYKMDQYAEDHMFFERLGPFSGIRDLEYFRLGFLHYLDIVDTEGHHLYIWNTGEFKMKQKLAVPNAVQGYAAHVESCRDEVILVTVTRDGSIHLHVFNGQNEEFITVDAALSPTGYLVRPGSVTSFTFQDSVVILFADFYNERKAFVVKTSLKPLRDPLLAKGEKISEVMKDIQNVIQNQDKDIKRIKSILKDAVRKKGTQHIKSVQYFQDLRATGEMETDKINEFRVEWEDSTLTLAEFKKGTDDLEKNVEYLEKIVEQIEKTMPDVVRLDEESVITGKKTFTGHVRADNLVATSVDLPTVAGMNLRQIQEEVYRLDKPQLIDGTLVFNEPLTIKENFDIEQTLNGIDISEEVMTTNTEQHSSAEMIFMEKLVVSGDLEVSGKVNDIDISEEVVTLSGSHHIRGKKIFMNGAEARHVQTEMLDGVNIDDLYRRALTISGDQIIKEDAFFPAVTTNNIVLKGMLNGLDVEELQKNIVRVDEPSTITGFKHFLNDVEIIGELTVHGAVNGLKIPDDLVLTDHPQTITGTKEFLGRVIANKVDVQGKVDGLRIPEDIVTLSGHEEISSTLYFADGIVAQRDIIVEGLVDGVDISEIAKQAMKLNETHKFNDAVFLGPVTISGDLNVRGLVNNVNLSHILGDVVYRDQRPIEITGIKHFKTLAADRINQIQGFINGFNLALDFMRVNGSEAITGIKTFKKVVFSSVNIEDDMIDGLNISDLYQRRLQIIVEDDSEINEEIEFVDDVIIEGNLVVHGTIDGIRIPQDVVLKNSDQPISNKVFSGRVTADNLIIDGDVEVGNLDGINLTEFYRNRVTLSGDQTIHGDVWVGNSVAEKLSVSGLVNRLNITDFAANVMSKTKPQTVTAVKEFAGSALVSGDIFTSEGVNGFSLSDIKKRAFKLLEDNLVTAPLEFEENITLSDLQVTGDINGVNIIRLSEDSLKKSGDIQHVQGNVHFHRGFHVNGDITATKVNDLSLPEDVLLKSIPQTIPGRFTFRSAGIEGDLNIKGSINGLDLSEVAPKLARIDDAETVIESDITFTSSIHVEEDIEVTGTVNEVHIRDLFDNVLRKIGDQSITGHKVFTGNVTILGDIAVKSVNGIGWKEFLDDLVWINVPQTIYAQKTFTNDISVQDSVFVSGAAHVQMVNGKDLNSFAEGVVFIDEPAHITGPIVFKSPVEITGDMNADLINGLRLKTDVITISCSDDGPQRITGLKTFQKIKVAGHIYTDSVNSYDLLKLYEDTLLTEGDQTVAGWKVVSGDVVFKKNVYPSLVNGMSLRNDLVTLHTEQVIEGPPIFQGDVFVEKDLFVKGLINGVDLNELEREAVYLSSDQIIEGSYSLQRATVASNVEVSGTVNGVDLVVFERNVTEFLKDAKYSVGIMERYVQDHCVLAKYLQESLENSYYALDSFVSYQKLDFAASFVQVKSNLDISLVYLDDAATSAVSVENVWDESARMFKASNFSVTFVAKSFLYQTSRITITVNIGINSEDSSLVIETSGYATTVETGFLDANVVLRKNDVAVTLLFPAKSVCNVYLIKEQPDKPYSFDLLASLDVSKESKSIAMFEVSGALHVAISSSFSHGASSKIYADVNGKWRQLQPVSSLGPLVKHFEYHGYHYLVFVNDVPVYASKPKSLQVYRNSGLSGRFVLFQEISFDGTRGFEVFQFGDSKQLHLVVWNGVLVQVFGLVGESGLKELFTIPGECVRDVKPLSIGSDLFLVVGQQNLEQLEASKSVLYKGITKGFKYDPYDLAYC